jgi:large repetitive protein
MAAWTNFAQAAGIGMNQTRYTLSKGKRTMARMAVVRLAFMLLITVAGSHRSFAAIVNDAVAIGTYAGQPVVSDIASASVDVTNAAPALLISKVATPDTNVTAGTVVTYTYTVQNSGNQVLTNITLNDVHSGSGPAPVPGNEILTADVGTTNDSIDTIANDGHWSTLAPGDVITLTATYTITQSDVDTQQ